MPRSRVRIRQGNESPVTTTNPITRPTTPPQPNPTPTILTPAFAGANTVSLSAANPSIARASPSPSLPSTPQPIPAGPWRCLCGLLCGTSGEFFSHSRACAARDGPSSPLSLRCTESSMASTHEGMRNSLCAAVSSGQLEGDTLAAAVRALGRAESEKRMETIAWGKKCLPRPFLPVSGPVLLAAAARWRGRGQIKREEETKPHEDSVTRVGGAGVYYTIRHEGLTYATRVAITDTYRPRAALTAGHEDGDGHPRNSQIPQDEDGHTRDDGRRSLSGNEPEKRERDGDGKWAAKLQYNAGHTDMFFYVYKRFMPRDYQPPCDVDSPSVETGEDSQTNAKSRRTESTPQPHMDEVLRQQRHRIARVPMPMREWYYPK